MLIQTLPPLADSYNLSQRRRIEQTVRAVVAEWYKTGARFETGWQQFGPAIIAKVLVAQGFLASEAAAFVPAVIAATEGVVATDAAAQTNTAALVGVTGGGFAVADSLAAVSLVALQAVAGGATTTKALETSASWLQQTVGTILADTERSSGAVTRYTRKVGYIRMVNGGACGRCVILAGRWYRQNAGFLRHPACRCFGIPASENVAGDWQTDPLEYFHSLNDAQQIKLMGSVANAQAVRDGANMGQIINAYRRSRGMSFAQKSPIVAYKGDKYTRSGTTKRAAAFQAQKRLRQNGKPGMRLMPESIFRVAKSREDALRLLNLYGWIL